MSKSKEQNNTLKIKAENVSDVLESQKELFKSIMNNISSFSFGKSSSNIGIAAVPLSLLCAKENVLKEIEDSCLYRKKLKGYQ